MRFPNTDMFVSVSGSATILKDPSASTVCAKWVIWLTPPSGPMHRLGMSCDND